MDSIDVAKRLRDAPHNLADFLHALPDDHPLQIALRTYSLALSLALGPALLPFITSKKARAKGLGRALQIVRRELGITAFASAITVGVAGGATIRHFWAKWEEAPGNEQVPHTLRKLKTWLASLKDSHKTFLSNIVSCTLAVALLHSRRSHSSLVQFAIFKPSEASERYLPAAIKQEKKAARLQWASRIDALVFWACSARIMWCFFYEPERIMTMANIDPRLLAALRAIRTGNFSYKRGTAVPPDLVPSLSRDLGYPATWGDPALLPAYGGPQADKIWKALGVSGRRGRGGLPCEVIHGNVAGGSCLANASVRGMQAFAEAVAIYLPVHILPILITRPRKLLRLHTLLSTLLSVARSASFLSTFVSSIWFAVCFARTLVLARLFPGIPHDFWDGPFGGTFLGCLLCGASIWIERDRRRGEMALYVLPRAIRACLPAEWIKSGRASVRWAERLVFILSLSTLLTAVVHRPDTLRGLSRWTLAFVMKGPNAGFWKRKRLGTNAPPTPRPPTPQKETEAST
ncbi:hypothetical protein BN946_scf184911.g40 [Trametes cinnabarina]|uniref:Transmembrane protein 135 N-terminal domain-containing protein n=1 Tax=Pycnoporus cinnabarinus TaxID=5643 RepID=A0A060SB40_PYCCI|nr:hypothetical protein BN946_scf184911.g40 [Trametes cinnabarina]